MSVLLHFTGIQRAVHGLSAPHIGRRASCSKLSWLDNMGDVGVPSRPHRLRLHPSTATLCLQPRHYLRGSSSALGRGGKRWSRTGVLLPANTTRAFPAALWILREPQRSN